MVVYILMLYTLIGVSYCLLCYRAVQSLQKVTFNKLALLYIINMYHNKFNIMIRLFFVCCLNFVF